MKALWDWFIACLPRWITGKGGVQGDDAPGGWQEPVYDDEQPDDPVKP